VQLVLLELKVLLEKQELKEILVAQEKMASKVSQENKVILV